MTRGALIVVLALLAPTAAFAQARPLDQAAARVEEADFDAAARLLDAAEDGSDLSRADVVRLYASRAAVGLALGRMDAMARDLARLDALEPHYELDAAARPELRDGLAACPHEALRLDLRFEALPGSARIVSAVAGDPGGLAREVHLRARVAGAAAWTEQTGDTLTVSATGAEVEYWGEVLGPGGAVLVTVGSAAAPLTARAGDAASAPVSEARGGTNWLWVGLGVGAGVVAIAVVVVLVVLLSGGSSDTQPGMPHILTF